jgi:exodeoxyribonuclease VII small subunit
MTMASPKSKDSDQMSFEDAMIELEQIVQKLESGNAPLDQSISLYERGAELRAVCEARLKDAQLRIEKIISAENGKAQTETVGYE